MALSEGISPQSEIWKNTMRQQCTVYSYSGADPTGQPQYGEGVQTICRLAIRTKRTVTDQGDYITNSSVTVVLPADCSVQAYDKIDLPAPYQEGAVIGEVITGTDFYGNVTHKVVRIA